MSASLNILIAGQKVDVKALKDFPFTISYALEDRGKFQDKKSATSFDVKLPATKVNDQVANSFHDVSVEDMTGDDLFKSPQSLVVEANGYELLVGKAFLKSATHTDKPEEYVFNFYGDNADWLIDLKEATLYDILKDINFTFNRNAITSSWSNDGRNEAMIYSFFPVKYGDPMGEMDDDIGLEYLKPSIFAYWVIYRAFKSVGYRIQSSFMDTNFFRRLAMPWTWGSFLNSSGTKLENLKFLAKSDAPVYISGNYNGVMVLNVTNDNVLPGFDNSGTYDWNGTGPRWRYLQQFQYGPITAHFHLQVYIDAVATANSDVNLTVRWFKNGILVNEDLLVNLNAPAIGRRSFTNPVDIDREFDVVPGDVISCTFPLHIFDSGTGRGNISAEVTTFEIGYFTLQRGANINFDNYTGFKNYKVLDFLKGIVSFFDLSVNTDAANKTVIFETTHPVKLATNETCPGYFNGDFIDWQGKQDVSKISNVDLNSDGERELVFNFKDDSADGALKIIQDRYNLTLGAGKFVLPNRFKAGKKEVPNPFFSAVMHYDVDQWKDITGVTPQMICLVPENISNTSAGEAQNTFQPKLVYYKGIQGNIGWKFDGGSQNNYPFAFAVNYMPGGQNDPVLSYSDEKVGNDTAGYVVAEGILKKFYLQRMAIQRNGQDYTTSMRLQYYDVAGQLHREFKIIRGQKWELVEIKSFRPLDNDSTECFLRKWTPITLADFMNCFPSSAAVLNGNSSANTFDTKYQQLKCLPSDIPKR